MNALKTNLFLVAISFAMVAQCSSPAMSMQSGLPIREQSKSQVKAHQKNWLAVRPHFSAYREQRWTRLLEYRQKIHRLVAATRTNISYKSFVDSLMDLDSAFKATGNRSSVEKHIGSLYSRKVIDMEQLQAATQKLFNEFNAVCAELDNELLIACRIDAEINPSALKECKVDSAMYQQHLASIRSEMTDRLYEICQAHVAATAVGLGAGHLGGSIASEFGKGANGADTIFSNMLYIAGDYFAAEAASDLTYQLMEVSKRTNLAVRAATEVMLESMVGTKDTFRGFDMGLVEIAKRHDRMMLNGLVDVLELQGDVKWVNQNLPE